MPELDGLSAFRIAQERGLDTPFIFVSGAIGEERAVEAMRAGASDYLVKGNLARLTAAVQREIDHAARRRQPTDSCCHAVYRGRPGPGACARKGQRPIGRVGFWTGDGVCSYHSVGAWVVGRRCGASGTGGVMPWRPSAS